VTGVSAAPALLWFRQDLRLSDNPALAAALERRSPVIPVFIWAPEEEGAWQAGAASRWWLHHSLASLSAEIEKRGSRLIIRRGPTAAALSRLVADSGASAVLWNRRYEPAAAARDRDMKSKLRESGLTVESFNGSLLFEPWTIRNSSEQPFRVFTPFWRACLNKPLAPVCKDAPQRLPLPDRWPHSLDLWELSLEPGVDWAGGFRQVWQPGESGAKRQLQRFLVEALAEYPVNRDRPGLMGTSRLSPHLHFGEISPGEVRRAILGVANGNHGACEAYLRQLGWREFAYHLLYHHPQSPHQALRQEFAAIRGRTLIIEVATGDVSTAVLTDCQVAATGSMYSKAMGGFVRSLAGKYEPVQATFQQRVLELRSQATRVHSRTPGIIADLYAGFELFLEFAATTGAITAIEQQEFGKHCWAALNAVARAQRVQQDASEPTHRFLELLRAAILSGEAHVAALNGGAPADDGEWGWFLVGGGDHQRHISRGKCVGWLDGSSLYLEPTASFGVAQDLGRATGEALVVSQATLKKRLKEKGLLASVDGPRETLTVRRMICGKSVPVLHLRSDVLSSNADSRTSAEEERNGNNLPVVFEC
jgi:hypothetical protein